MLSSQSPQNDPRERILPFPCTRSTQIWYFYSRNSVSNPGRSGALKEGEYDSSTSRISKIKQDQAPPEGHIWRTYLGIKRLRRPSFLLHRMSSLSPFQRLGAMRMPSWTPMPLLVRPHLSCIGGFAALSRFIYESKQHCRIHQQSAPAKE